MDKEELLNIVTDNDKLDYALNIRLNGKLLKRNVKDDINILSKTDKDGIDIIVKDGTVKKSVAIPVLLTQGEFTETVYNDFFIGDNCDVVIVAGCGIENCSSCTSQHNGVHTFYIGRNSKVRYIERHYGHKDVKAEGTNIFNPQTIVYLKENSEMIMDTTQIEGVDGTVRTTKAEIGENASLIVNEKVLTTDNQRAKSEFYVNLNGEHSRAKVSSRQVAKDSSFQEFYSDVEGNNKCFAHVECDAIIVNKARVSSVPKIIANDPDASLVHEATIGKIAGEQLLKLLTLGLDEKQAEQEIIKGFLR